MNLRDPDQLALLSEQLHHIITAPVFQTALFVGLLLGALLLAAANRRHKRRLAEACGKIEQLQTTLTRNRLREVRLATLLRNERKNANEKLSLLEESREELRLQFASLAQQIFDEKQEKFNSQSKEKLEAILAPFHLQLDALKQEISTTYLNDTRERATLKEEIVHLRELNRQINEEAINLTRALKGDTRMQGNWGELVLEKVLQQSGLRKDHEYEVQKGYRDADKRLFKPDVILHLPEGKDIIIDSKVSLVSWEKYCSCEDEQKKGRHLAELVRAVRDHITTLGNKNYADLEGLQSLDFVLMFMPIEAAFLAAVQHDESLFTDGFANRVVVVTPATLLATLRTIENIWRYEHQSRNALEIARRAGLMYDKFRGFIDDLEKVGKALTSCHASYESAMNKLSRGRGNLVAQAGQLTELGVQTKKDLPKTMTGACDQEIRN